MAEEEALVGFAPVDFFFQEEVDCQYAESGSQLPNKKYLLPRLCEVYGHEAFAVVWMGWQQAGLLFRFEVQSPKELSVSYPDFRQGDSIELFIDTRAVLQARTTHRFCHHFFFLPELFEGRQAGEITRFRTEDTHPLCAPELLEVNVVKSANGYTASIFIPSECLVGYDAQAGGRLSFTYRINRFEGPCQSFAFSAELARIEQLPYLWTTLRLVGGE